MVDGTHLELQGSAFANAYVSGGTVNCVVAVDVATTVGSTTAAVGPGVTINGTSATQMGYLIVVSGVTLTLQGYDASTNAMMKINRYGTFAPQAGSTVVGSCTSDYKSVVVNNGIISAIGTSGSPITFTSPSSSYSWANSASAEALAPGGNTYYDGPNRVAAMKLAHTWIANSGGTGPAATGNTSLVFTAQSGDSSVPATVSGAANNGSGLIRIATSPAHPFSTGNVVTVASVGGVAAATGTWTVTVIDSTHFDLQGSAFSGTYTSGGTAKLSILQTEVPMQPVTAIASGGSGPIRLTSASHGYSTGNRVYCWGIPGAIGAFTVTAIDANTLDLQGTAWEGRPYSGGGQVAAVTSAGTYCVDYDTGSIFFYWKFTSVAPTATAAYKYLSIAGGWGIQTAANTSYNSATFQYCQFQYMGPATAAANNAALVVASLGSPTSKPNQTFNFTYNTVTNCQRFLSLQSVAGASADYVHIDGNAFNQCGQMNSPSAGWTILLYRGTGNSYVSVSGNALNALTFLTDTMYGTVVTNQSLQVQNNTGRAVILAGNGTVLGCLYADAAIKGNTVAGICGAFASPCISSMAGTSGHPVVISGNCFAGYYTDCVSFSSYNTITANEFYLDYHAFINPTGQAMMIAGVVVTDNFFYGPTGADMNPYGIEAGFVSTVGGVPHWIDGLQVANNTMVANPNGGFDVGDPLLGNINTATGVEVRNNLIVNAGTQWGTIGGTTNYGQAGGPGVAIQRLANGRTVGANPTRTFFQALELDDHGLYQDGCPYATPGATLTSPCLSVIAPGTFLMSGSKYNYNNSRNVTGVALHSPGYCGAAGRAVARLYDHGGRAE